MLTSVGQMFINLGSTDPQLNKFGKTNFRLSCQFGSYKQKYSPSVRIKPLPVSVVTAALIFAIIDSHSEEQEFIANMICITFYYYMRPGKYTGRTTDDQTFALKSITFYIGYAVSTMYYIPIQILRQLHLLRIVSLSKRMISRVMLLLILSAVTCSAAQSELLYLYS